MMCRLLDDFIIEINPAIIAGKEPETTEETNPTMIKII